MGGDSGRLFWCGLNGRESWSSVVATLELLTKKLIVAINGVVQF